MKAAEIMTRPAITISSDASLREACDVMIERNLSCLLVLDDDVRLVGILTHSDFGMKRRVLAHGEPVYTMLGHWASPEAIEKVSREVSTVLVRDVMSCPVTTVDEDSTIEEAAKLMVSNRINRLPVMREERVIGIITRHDFLKLLASQSISAQLWTPAPR